MSMQSQQQAQQNAARQREMEFLRARHADAKKGVLTKGQLNDLMRKIDSNQTLDADLEEALIAMANDFVERVVTSSCQLAKHRGSDMLEAKDVQLHLERYWDLRVSGLCRDDVRPARASRLSEAHRQKLQLAQKEVGNVASRKRPAAGPPPPRVRKPAGGAQGTDNDADDAAAANGDAAGGEQGGDGAAGTTDAASAADDAAGDQSSRLPQVSFLLPTTASSGANSPMQIN
eukprot:m.62322 g.62322  ORF g.62322 m.62322 type:complete len:231 (-) comp13792_c0_seq1:347-1039(-)